MEVSGPYFLKTVAKSSLFRDFQGSPAGGLLKQRKLLSKFHTKQKDTPKYVTLLARENRLNPTPQEEKLWQFLSGKKLQGLKFRRQFPIGRYVVDFYNHPFRLVIEVDGSVHSGTREYDKNRDNYLKACGYNVIRLTNSQVEDDLELVIFKILDSIKVPLRGI